MLEARGHYPLPRQLPSDPIDVERWHADAVRAISFYAGSELAARLRRMADDLDQHVQQLEARENALNHQRRRFAEVVRQWRATPWVPLRIDRV